MNEKTPQQKSSAEAAIEKEILATENFNQLYSVLEKLGSLEGSQTTYSSAELKKLIEEVRTGAKTADYVTRTGGLRMQVIRLAAADTLSTKEAAIREVKFKDTTLPPGTVLH